MVEKDFTLKFDGYWRDEVKASIPKNSGIYCVYECTHNQEKKNVTIHRLIYIGEADNVNDRISNHEKRDQWMNYVRSGNTLCYSFGSFPKTDRDRVEAALIFKHKPPVNEEYKNNFPFDKTTISLSGEIKFLIPNFTVEGTD